MSVTKVKLPSGLLEVRVATKVDVPVIYKMIRGIAEFEKLAHEVTATEEGLMHTLFGKRPCAEVLIANFGGEDVAFALFFHNYSTFLGKPGLYLEDLFVMPSMRGKGIGKTLLKMLATLAVERGCGRMEWAVLDWNKNAREFYESVGARPMTDWIIHRLTGQALEDFGRSAVNEDR